MRQGKLYKSIMKEVERSTTKDSIIRDGNGFIVLIPSNNTIIGTSVPKE